MTQLLDSPLTACPANLVDFLYDIVHRLQIQPNFCISHPDYKPFQLPAEVAARFQQVPLELQNKYLSLQLRSFLYGIYYNGSMRNALAASNNSDLAPHQNLENNSLLGVDLKFYEQLHLSNRGEGYFDPEWKVLRQETDGSFAVKKGALTLHVEPRHLPPGEHVSTGNSVSVRMPRNLVQNGFYMAVGNAGSRTHPQIVRVYFNLSSDGAIAVMKSLTQQLNETAIPIPFTFKVLYNPADYGRYDSGVLYFEKSHYETVRQVLKHVYVETQSHFQKSVPLFTKLLAPGLALAEEPDQKFAAQESFGMNRCQIVANGLLAAQQQGDDPESRMSAICEHFSMLGIELKRPYLNANSEDIYTPLDYETH